MATTNTNASSSKESESENKEYRTITTIKKRAQNGSMAILAGGALLARILKTPRKSMRRNSLHGLVGVALIAVGLRQRRGKRKADRVDTGADGRWSAKGEKEVSDEAHAETKQDLGAQRAADETGSVYQSETEPNPRGMSDRSGVQSDHKGDIHFVEGEEPGVHRKTHLEDEDAHDTRLHPESDAEPTEVDLSAAAMADEASEAAGPHTEQAYPAREGTDPEPTSEKAPERVGEGAVAPTGPDVENDSDTDKSEEDEENEETLE